MSIQTSNHYLRAIKQFTRWLVKDRRASDDPLTHMAMLNVSTDRRHDRRPFSEEELSAILQAANAGPIVRRMKGPDRAMLYAVAAYTGLRASELASLMPESFDLDSDPATVTVQAAYSKHRRQDVLPLHPSLVALLRPWLAAKPEGQSVWPGNWAKGKEAGAMLKADLERARAAWIEEAAKDEQEVKRRQRSNFLAYKDERWSLRRFPRPAAHLHHQHGQIRNLSEGSSVAGPALDHRPHDERLHLADRSRPGVRPCVPSPDPGVRREGSRGGRAFGNGDGWPGKGAHSGAERCRKGCHSPRIGSV